MSGLEIMRVVRHMYPDKATIGTWYLPDRSPLCVTLEDEVREPEDFVAGETAIVACTAIVELCDSQRFGRKLPLIYSDAIPASRGIRVHRGVHIGHTLGCVLVGFGFSLLGRPHLTDGDRAELAVVEHITRLGGKAWLEIIEVNRPTGGHQ